VCPKGSPDAGKPGVVIVNSWPNFESKSKGTQPSGQPQNLLFSNGQLITMAFVPVNATIPKPPANVITSLINAVEQGTSATTSTTAPALSTTSTTAPVPSTTSTTAGSTTSTTK
jgi:hypothetical protein